MEIMGNSFTVTFTNAAAANKAKQIAAQNLRAFEAANFLAVEDEVTLTLNGCYFFSEELIDVSKDVLKGIATNLPEEDFTFDISGSDTYTEGWVEGNYQNGVLDLTTTYFPEGYSEYLECPECGEEVIRMEDYDPDETYVCPECGEELDFSDSAPEVKKELITIR